MRTTFEIWRFNFFARLVDLENRLIGFLFFLKTKVVFKMGNKNLLIKTNKIGQFLEHAPKIETNGFHKKMRTIQHRYQPHSKSYCWYKIKNIHQQLITCLGFHSQINSLRVHKASYTNLCWPTFTWRHGGPLFNWNH